MLMEMCHLDTTCFLKKSLNASYYLTLCVSLDKLSQHHFVCS